MKAQVLDNINRKTGLALCNAIHNARELRFAVAFVSMSGLDIIDQALRETLDRGGFAEFLVGLDMNVTEPAALEALHGMAGQHGDVSLYCYVDPAARAIYHPKLYLCSGGEAARAIVGSSNLTEGGLSRNIEANIHVEATVRDELMSDVFGTYAALKFHPKRMVPDAEFLDIYRQAWETARKARRSTATQAVPRKLMDAYREKARTLSRPRRSRRDLVGWLDLVYDALPEGEFTNQQVYASEGMFRERFPDNQNIRDKVRQQLQQLRDLGFIEHVDRGRWRKL